LHHDQPRTVLRKLPSFSSEESLRSFIGERNSHHDVAKRFIWAEHCPGRAKPRSLFFSRMLAEGWAPRRVVIEEELSQLIRQVF
jgi:hypothetical protein